MISFNVISYQLILYYIISQLLYIILLYIILYYIIYFLFFSHMNYFYNLQSNGYVSKEDFYAALNDENLTDVSYSSHFIRSGSDKVDFVLIMLCFYSWLFILPLSLSLTYILSFSLSLPLSLCLSLSPSLSLSLPIYGEPNIDVR